MWGLLPLDKTAPGGFLPWGNFGSRREVESLGRAKQRALRSEGVEQLDEDEDIRGGGEGIEDDVKWGEGGGGGGGGEGEEVEKQVAGTKPRCAEADDADNDAGVITSFASTH